MASMALNATIFALSLIAWMQLAFTNGRTAQLLAAPGRSSFRYFTVLSNLFSGIVSLAYLVVVASALGTGGIPTWALVLKLVAAAAVMLTFCTVVVLLGPAFGWQKMYMGGNFWLHLVLPLLALFDCVFFVPVGTLSIPTTLCAMLPTALYGAWYLRAILVHGAEENGIVYDFYGFLRWGRNRLALVVAGMLAVSWLLGLGIHFASRLLGP